jgi:uncharacterized protein YydD (DUF2326 family)
VELADERSKLKSELRLIDERRRTLLSVLRGEAWFERFKQLQSEIARLNAEISRLEAQLANVDRLEDIQKSIDALEEHRAHLVAEIREEVRNGNPAFELIRRRFNEIYRSVFGVPALLSVQPNSEGNVEFEANPVHEDDAGLTTSEGEGHTYRKVLCAAFDLALLEAYRSRSFYRFVYHDGIFESLDDRKKLNLLRVVRDSTQQNEIQYLMSVIDADVPRNASGRRVDFEQDEVILELHDNGDDGRLFRMPKF